MLHTRTPGLTMFIRMAATVVVLSLAPLQAQSQDGDRAGDRPAPGPAAISLLAIGGVGLVHAWRRRRNDPSDETPA